MSADQVVEEHDESVASEDVVVAARNLGWKPKEEFKGDPSKWVPADQYVEFSNKVIPILQASNQRLLQTQNALEAKVNKLTQELEASKGDFQSLQEFQNEQVVLQVKKAREDLLNSLKDAKREGDTDREVDLTDQLTRLNTAQAEVESAIPTGKATPAQIQETIAPEMAEWMAANKDWFDVDRVKTSKAVGIGWMVKADRPDLTGKAFLDEVDRRLAKAEQTGGPRAGKVASGSTGTGVSGGDGRTYADLPAEAKQACDKFAKKFVNPKGNIKTEADARKHYIKNLEATGYFADNR